MKDEVKKGDDKMIVDLVTVGKSVNPVIVVSKEKSEEFISRKRNNVIFDKVMKNANIIDDHTIRKDECISYDKFKR